MTQQLPIVHRETASFLQDIFARRVWVSRRQLRSIVRNLRGLAEEAGVRYMADRAAVFL